MGTCLSSLSVFLRSMHDMKRRVGEVKNDLHEIKNILEGSLRICDNTRLVSLQVKQVVQFYVDESREIVRNHLQEHWSTEGKEEMKHREFGKKFKFTFEEEISLLIENNQARHTRIAILEITKHLKNVIDNLKLHYEEDTLKLIFLQDLEDYLKESFDLYGGNGFQIPLHNYFEDLDESEGTPNGDGKIKVFCEKQKCQMKLQDMIKLHFDPHECSETKEDSSHLVYGCSSHPPYSIPPHERKIGRLSRYLATKIKSKKFGNFYRDEISFQIGVDLKKAAEQVAEFEKGVETNCDALCKIIKEIPRERLRDKRPFQDLCKRWRKYSGDQAAVADTPEEIANYGEENDTQSTQDYKDNNSLEISETHFPNANDEYFDDIDEKILPDRYKICYIEDDNKEKKNSENNEETCISGYDLDLIHQDIEKVITPILNYAGHNLLKMAVNLIDDPSFLTGKIYAVAEAVDGIICRPEEIMDLCEQEAVTETFLELVAVELDMSELLVLKKLLKACHHSRLNRKKLTSLFQSKIEESAFHLSTKGKDYLMSEISFDDSDIDHLKMFVTNLIQSKISVK